MNLNQLMTKIFDKGKVQGRRTKTGLQTILEISDPSQHALDTARIIRGVERKPSIHLHGILPRSGTNFLGDLLGLHPEICAFPNNIWEFPYLEGTGELLDFSGRFFNSYKRNRSHIGQTDFLPVFGASAVSYLHGFVPAEKRLLVKVPDVQFLNHFPITFPFENLVILLRDGRDLVNSTIKSWPERKFSDVCRLWDSCAKMILNFKERYNDSQINFLIVHFEDAVHSPEATIKLICDQCDLDFDKFPVEEINKLPVKGSSELKDGNKMTWQPIEKPQDFNPVGRWKDWPPKWKSQFKSICGDTMLKIGNCKDLNW